MGTFLNTGIATNNPQTNVEQASQTQASSVNAGATSTQNNQINPITIPIQLQPQIVQTGQSQITSNIQPNSNLQVTSNQSNQTYNAPTPQTYQGTNRTNNVVDFNQIYSSYNQTVGNTNTNTNTSSGIKKTSLGTTIVTPTITNLNTVKGQYQSAYADNVNGLISEMLSQMKNGFSYDPTQDNALKMASEYAANSTLQSLAGSGVLNSSSTSERVARIVSELIPQYEEKAHDRWIEYLGQLADTAQIVMNYDSQQFEYWKDAKDREFQEKEFEYKKQQDSLENAWKRVDELGYVDNEASTILGVKVGTLSGEARLAKEQREFELEKMREQAQIEYDNNVALYKLKNELDLESSKSLAKYQSSIDKDVYSYKSSVDTANNKELADYQANIDKDMYSYKSSVDTTNSKELAAYQNSLNNSSTEYEYQLAQKYGSSNNNKSSSTVSLSTYDDIIKNRWATYDDINKIYTVSDKQSVYNYLKDEYASGRISANDVASLMSKYGISEISSNASSTTNNSEKIQTMELKESDLSTWIKALDGNNDALNTLGVTIWGQKKSNVNNKDAKNAVNEAYKQIQEGKYTFTSNQQLMNDLKNGKFGKLGWGL